MRKDRGLLQLDSYLENFSSKISKKIQQTGKARVLDAGCGYGLAMAGLIKKFGNSITLVGYNLNKEHGTIEDFKEKSVKRDIFTKEDLKNKQNLPKIFYFDADKGLPFESDSFDFIFSLGSVYLYKDKIKFFEECNRVLKKGGLARISLFETKQQPKKKVLHSLNKHGAKYFWEIFQNRKEINFINYFKKIKNIRIGVGKRDDKDHAVIYLEIKKSPKLDFNLKLTKIEDLRKIAPDRFWNKKYL